MPLPAPLFRMMTPPPRPQRGDGEEARRPGEAIRKGHRSYSLMVNLQLGDALPDIDSGPTCGAILEALVGVGGDRGSGADEVMVVGGGVGGCGDEEDRVLVVGEERDEKLGSHNGYVEGIREGIAGSDRAKGNGEEGKKMEVVVVAVEKTILVEDFSCELDW
ncbi:Os09g0343100 [Oryza sativa Japonica Group]|uniref:Os09g0343100 protein n=1 Tax=Oryza sativa subsp. japonica TaxID=39947 RepID=A0A0P0XKZ1_ORYSJ|nr:Os09g0343100 [Oryza sativa Japonica Group]